MWKLDFYILPSSSYDAIDTEDIWALEEKTGYLEKKEILYVPNEIYVKEDKNGVTLTDYLYNRGQNDESDLLLEIISKQRMCSDTYEEIEKKKEYGYLPMAEHDITESIAQICIGSIKDMEEEKYLKVNDVTRLKRFYIAKVNNYKLYKDRAKACYPNLIFHEDAFQYVQELGKCIDVVEELTRHLTVLNDVGKKLYDYYNKNEFAVLSEFKSGYGIECSGKGSNEKESFNKEMIYDGCKFQLTCNPHTKLFQKRTDQRIYFCWGRDEIESHNIIVVRIGGHWKE